MTSLGDDGMERILCGGHGMRRGAVLEVGMVRASLKEGPNDWRAGSKGRQDEAGEAAGMGPCKTL